MFRGDDADINYEAAKFQQMYFSSTIYTDWTGKYNAIKDYDDVKYKQYRDSIRNEEKNLFNRFVEKYNPAKEVRIWASTYLDAEYYENLIQYPQSHMYDNKIKPGEWSVPVTYYNFIKNLSLVNDSVLICGNSLSLLVNHYWVYIDAMIRDENKAIF